MQLTLKEKKMKTLIENFEIISKMAVRVTFNVYMSFFILGNQTICTIQIIQYNLMNEHIN